MDSHERAMLDRYITGNYGEDQFKYYDCMEECDWDPQPLPYRMWAWEELMHKVYGYHLYYDIAHPDSHVHRRFFQHDLPAYRKRAWKRHMAKRWNQRKRGYHDDEKWWRPASDILIEQCARQFGEYYGAGAIQLRDLP